MKFCAYCGIRIPDEAIDCPNCKTPNKTSSPTQQSTRAQKSHSSKNFNKMIIVIPCVVILTAFVTTICSYFTLLYLNDAFPIKSYVGNTYENANGGSGINSDALDNCPASEYGYHDWNSATCQDPSYCLDCQKQKDDKLGNHNWHKDDDGDLYCLYCGLPYNDYVASNNESESDN